MSCYNDKGEIAIREHPLMMSDGKIVQNRTRWGGSLAKLEHPIILVFSHKKKFSETNLPQSVYP